MVGQDELRAEQELDLYNKHLEQLHDNDFIGFGQDRQDDGNAVGAIGMLGPGANMNTLGGANFARNLNPKHKERYSQHSIYLNELA